MPGSAGQKGRREVRNDSRCLARAAGCKMVLRRGTWRESRFGGGRW